MHPRNPLRLVPVALFLAAASAGAQPAMTDSRYLFLFHERCATCHGVNSPVPQAASLEALRAFTPERVYEALSTGTMAVNAAELGDEEKRGLATYLTGKPFGSAVDRSAEAMPNVCANDLVPEASLARARWNGSNADSTTGARFQSAADAVLTADEVPRLALRWSFGLPGSGGMRAQPVVVGGRVFLGSDNGFVYALDARSGCVHWSFDAGTPVVSAVSVGTVPGTEREAVYFGDWGAHLHAVDADSGRPLWKVRVDEHPMAKITGSPVLEPGGRRLYVPVGSWEEGASLSNGQYECCTSQGSVVALDTATGSEIWKSYTIPERPRPVRENWLGVQQLRSRRSRRLVRAGSGSEAPGGLRRHRERLHQRARRRVQRRRHRLRSRYGAAVVVDPAPRRRPELRRARHVGGGGQPRMPRVRQRPERRRVRVTDPRHAAGRAGRARRRAGEQPHHGPGSR